MGMTKYVPDDAKSIVRILLNEFADMVADKLSEKVHGMITDNKPSTYNSTEVAAMLHVTPQTLNNYIKQGKLKPINSCKGRGRLFDADDIDAIIQCGLIRKGAVTK